MRPLTSPSRFIRLLGGLFCAAALTLVAAACGGSHSKSTSSPAALATPPAAPSSSWPSVGNDLAGERYSTANEITPAAVAKKPLSPAFATDLDPAGVTQGVGGEGNPIEVGGVIYAASSSADPTIGAYDALTGKPIWQKTASELGITVGKNLTGTRGVALGGGLLYVDEPGGILVGLNPKTGKRVWATLINTQHVAAYSQGTPVYADGEVFIGQSGSDIIGGIRGIFKAVDAKTGKLLWTFHVLPQPGTAAAKTWGSAKELSDGGGAVWSNATVDPKLGLVYVPTGNPWPDLGRTPGNELYTDSMVALHIKTGQVAWYFQTTRHDEWDYDCVSPPVLWDQQVNGSLVHGISFGCKNGYVYQLNRATGQPVTPVKYLPLQNAKSDPAAKKFDEQKLKWLGDNGQSLTEPIPVGAGEVTPHCASPALLHNPAPNGKPYEYSCAYNYYSPTKFVAGTQQDTLDWNPSSYDPTLGYNYFCTNNGVRSVGIRNLKAKQTNNDLVWPQLYGKGDGIASAEPHTGWISAVNVRTDKVAWRYSLPTGDGCTGGTAATAGGLVFASDMGHMYALNSKTGKLAWTYKTAGLAIDAPPIVYTAGGHEHVAVIANVGSKAELVSFELNGHGMPGTTQTQAPGSSKGSASSGASIFTTNCASCHTLAAASSTGTVGPNLDQLKPNQAAVQAQVINGGGKMPSFKGTLSAAQIKAVAKYVSSVAGAKSHP